MLDRSTLSPPGSSVLVCIPSSDVAFRVHAETALELLRRDPEPVTAERLRAEIAKAYPEVSVHARQDLARLHFADSALYAYRDPYAATRRANEPWWEDAALPRTTVSADGRYLDANKAAAELFGVGRKRILDGRAGDFTRHEGPHLAKPLFETLLKVGHLDSTAVVIRPDGTEVTVEYHTIRDGAGADRHVTVMRTMADTSP